MIDPKLNSSFLFVITFSNQFPKILNYCALGLILPTNPGFLRPPS